ncbi:hypothetical protein GGF37_004181 [Kickxella alabastrina]|nr:hypothetical protein GGF37_004181 [Kickxella alabastrina]
MTQAPGIQRCMLVQWCMSAQLFSEAKFRQEIRRIYRDNEVEMQEIIESINNSLATYSLELRSIMDQITGERMWALSNTTADSISIAATPYSSNELPILKSLVEEIYTERAGNYALSLHSALKYATEKGPAGFTKTNAEALISRFCQDDWLSRDNSGYIVLGARAAIELRSFLADGFGDYQRQCALCSESATRGIVCPECSAVVHPYCAERIASSVDGNQLSCPGCHQQMVRPRRFGAGEAGVPHVFEATQADSVNLTQQGRKRVMEDSEDEDDE